MEGFLNLIFRLFWGWGFHSLTWALQTYSWKKRWGFLHFRYRKQCLVSHCWFFLVGKRLDGLLSRERQGWLKKPIDSLYVCRHYAIHVYSFCCITMASFLTSVTYHEIDIFFDAKLVGISTFLALFWERVHPKIYIYTRQNLNFYWGPHVKSH